MLAVQVSQARLIGRAGVRRHNVDSPGTLGKVHERIEQAHSLGASLRADIESALTGVYTDPKGAADVLVSQAEEFGVEHAVESYVSRPTELGEVRHVGLVSWTETRATLAEQLPRLRDAHERLDELLAQRDQLAMRANGSRGIHIQGVEYNVDDASETIQRADGLEAPCRLETVAERLPSLTEQLSKDVGAGQAQPSHDEQPRTRGR